jgi:hypothetical protein
MFNVALYHIQVVIFQEQFLDEREPQDELYFKVYKMDFYHFYGWFLVLVQIS